MQEQQQQKLIEIHNMFSKINKKIKDINISTSTILDSGVPVPNREIPILLSINAKIQTSYKLVYTTLNLITNTLKENSLIDLEEIREKYQEIIININSIWESPIFTQRIDDTIDYGQNEGLHEQGVVHDRVNEDKHMKQNMQKKVNEIIKKMQNELAIYTDNEQRLYKDTYALFGEILGYLEFMERTIVEHIKQLQEQLSNPANSGGKKKRKTKKSKKKANTKKSKTKKSKTKKSKMKKIKRKTMKKKKSKKQFPKIPPIR